MRRLRACVLALLAIVSLAAPAAHAWPHAPNQGVHLSQYWYSIAPRCVADGAGGFIVAYADYRNGTADIIVQHYNAAGNALWGAAGVVVCSALANQYPEEIIADGFGGAIAYELMAQVKRSAA